MSSIHSLLNDSFKHPYLLDDVSHMDLFSHSVHPFDKHAVSFARFQTSEKAFLWHVKLKISESDSAAVPLHLIFSCLN